MIAVEELPEQKYPGSQVFALGAQAMPRYCALPDTLNRGVEVV